MPPQNAEYYYAAYVAAAIVYGAYTVSVLVRTARARRRLELLSAHAAAAAAGDSPTARSFTDQR
jgi:uncharacterized membrane-anchored protein